MQYRPFVAPGDHHIHAISNGRATSTDISTVAGKEYHVALAFPAVARIPAQPMTEFPPSPAVEAMFHPFRVWPIVIGSTLVATGIVSGFVFTGFSSGASDNATVQLGQIQADGKTCAKTPAENDPRCAGYEAFLSRSSTYSTAAIASFITAGVITAGVVGFTIYETNRVSVDTTVSSISATYRF